MAWFQRGTRVAQQTYHPVDSLLINRLSHLRMPLYQSTKAGDDLILQSQLVQCICSSQCICHASDRLVIWTMWLTERVLVVWLAEGRDAVGHDGAVDRLWNTLFELAPRVVDLMRECLVDWFLEWLGMSRLHAKLPHICWHKWDNCLTHTVTLDYCALYKYSYLLILVIYLLTHV